ncbi:ribose 5-phosphate isomerase B [Campylobacter sp. faydin G-24]|uniref:Ribose 5-phosphate isomerase B n=1 Tax=Campylobacter anatolicus TaxID=2829105 RepID=A0ABS5HK33_9BACT|nr:ribose 5-phosphate isomerase B [Campylobacter anatolicus]MBR8461963.1 ribose 5-phosphate isomerase B [Campylobacter anatolicus]MBR8464360.1 ribose 5-phosphate isomerase B [Campylobacter anatolicus]MBR8464948.1 ribose 5-phosphate isomerase B [Campylobacter anatolicus]
MKSKRILIASDHAGFALKSEIKENLINLGYEVVDLGAQNDKDSVDYPDFAHALAQSITPDDRGILICGTGIGISIAANRHNNVRCALCHDETTASLAREHNDANVIAMGARVIEKQMALKMLNIFLNTEFSGGRHERRIAKIEPNLAKRSSDD